jgi:hypothetical protein
LSICSQDDFYDYEIYIEETQQYKKTREEYVSKYVHPDTNKVIDKYERRAKKRIKNRAKMGYHIGFPMGYPFRVK